MIGFFDPCFHLFSEQYKLDRNPSEPPSGRSHLKHAHCSKDGFLLFAFFLSQQPNPAKSQELADARYHCACVKLAVNMSMAGNRGNIFFSPLCMFSGHACL